VVKFPFLIQANSLIRAGCAAACTSKIRVEFVLNFLPKLLHLHAKIFQNMSCDSLIPIQQSQEDMFRSNVGVTQIPGFFSRKCDDLLCARRKENVRRKFAVPFSNKSSVVKILVLKSLFPLFSPVQKISA
jgi:hypothetical protein